MNIKQELKIDKFIQNASQVKIYYFEDEIYGQILSHSKKFIVIREIKDWHYDGYIIFPKKYISRIRYGRLEKFREQIINQQDINDIDWLDISSYKALFTSLQNEFNQVSIEGATENVNQFVMGIITSFDKFNLYIKKLSPYGKLDKEETKIPKKEITAIYFNDEYSSKLFEYASSKGINFKLKSK